MKTIEEMTEACIEAEFRLRDRHPIDRSFLKLITKVYSTYSQYLNIYDTNRCTDKLVEILYKQLISAK